MRASCLLLFIYSKIIAFSRYNEPCAASSCCFIGSERAQFIHSSENIGATKKKVQPTAASQHHQCRLAKGGRLPFKVETEPHIKSPVRQNMCNITCMFHEVSDKTFGVGTTSRCYVVYAFTSIYSILILMQRLWFSLFFVCTRTCLWANRPLLVVLYLFNTIVVWTEGIINRLTKHTILLLGWENPV